MTSSSPFAALLGIQPTPPEDWPAERRHVHLLGLDDDGAAELEARRLQAERSRDAYQDRRKQPCSPEKRERIRAGVLAAQVQRAGQAVTLAPTPAPPPAPLMTYAQAIAIRERSRNRQPVSEADLLQANQVVEARRAEIRKMLAEENAA